MPVEVEGSEMSERKEGFVISDTKDVQRSPDFKSIYANSSNVRLSMWDITIIFNKLVSSVDGGALTEEQVEVTCSPAHMKAVASALTAAVNIYEENYGKVVPVKTVSLDVFREAMKTLVEKQEQS